MQNMQEGHWYLERRVQARKEQLSQKAETLAQITPLSVPVIRAGNSHARQGEGLPVLSGSTASLTFSSGKCYSLWQLAG